MVLRRGDDTRVAAIYGWCMAINEMPSRSERPRSLLGSNFVLPLVVGVIQVVGTYFASHRQPDRVDLDALGFLLLALGPASLMLRRRYPVAVLWFVLAATLGYLLLDYPTGPIFLALIVALVMAVMSGHRLAAITSLVVGYASFLWLPYLVGAEAAPTWAQALGLGAWLLVLFTVSEIARSRRERALELARTRAEEAKRRASEERLRIARELHDVLAHNISLINVQAGVALHLTEDLPEQARGALMAIKQASVEALGELQSVLEVLRQGYESPPRLPTSGLARLDDLVAKTEAAGLRVTTEIEGRPRPLPRGIDLAAFRIVQEALTNVTRHAGHANATIRIGYGERDLTVQIDDDGSGPGSEMSSGGRGISGMRERVVALAGDFEAGTRPEGGFRVRVRLPLRDDGSEKPA
jgi:signal transduction histidine kinase